MTHDLGIIAKMCDKVAVMYAGKIVELQSCRGVFYEPKHPYTKALMDSIPKLGSKEPLYAIPGSPPDLSALPPGCSFSPRCPRAQEKCFREEPLDVDMTTRYDARCWYPIQGE